MKIIHQIIDALNKVEVKGADNLDRLLASIQGLQRLDAEVEAIIRDNNNQQGQNLPSTVDRHGIDEPQNPCSANGRQ